MEGIVLILFIASVLILVGIYLLISGYKGISDHEINTKKYDVAKMRLKGGIVIFVILGVILLIGFSACLGAL